MNGLSLGLENQESFTVGLGGFAFSIRVSLPFLLLLLSLSQVSQIRYMMNCRDDFIIFHYTLA